jgi:N-acyl-D-amino-acid deacylase
MLSRAPRLVLLALLLSGLASPLFAQDQQFDLLILNGRVFDGTGNPWIQWDIGVRGNQIVALGDLKGALAARTIDARGLYVAPGFIDLHSHADRALTHDHPEPRKAASHISQGITTAVGGPDGRNARWPLSEEVAAYERQGIAMNEVLMVGHNTLRGHVMGDDYEREATPQEVARMKELVHEAMEQGAWGLSAGLEYRPGRFSTPEEVVELASVAAPYDAFYIAHQRSEAAMPLWQLPSLVDGWPIDGLQGLQETINIARQTGLRVVASHHKSRGRASFGRSAHDTIVVNRARSEEGLEVYLDVYPYETYGGGPMPVLPNWALVDPGIDISGGNDSPVFRQDAVFANARENLRRRWADPTTRRLVERDIEYMVDHQGGPDRVWVVAYPDPSLVGKTLEQLSRERGLSYPELVVHLALEGDPENPYGAETRGEGIHDLDVITYIKQPYTATSSDAAISGIPGVRGFEGGPGSHPRHFGAFVRKIARYAKDLQAIPLAHAIRAGTGLPAQIIGLTDRGLIREGYKADIAIFDYDQLRDHATLLEPDRPSEGVRYVLVNGQLAVDDGHLTGALAGEVIRKPRPATIRTTQARDGH